jgi:hypothetical protein
MWDDEKYDLRMVYNQHWINGNAQYSKITTYFRSNYYVRKYKSK